MWRILVVSAVVVLGPVRVEAHDIPNARVDRSIQATLSPGHLRVDYEISLSDLTVAQDLRALGEEIPTGDRQGLFDVYGRKVGPLNARGLLVAVDGTERELRCVGFVLSVQDHPRYTFHFDTEIGPAGRLTINDTNYESGEGTSRLAVRGVNGVAIRGDTLPADVSAIPIRPAWQMTDAEDRRTRRVTVDFTPTQLSGPSPRFQASPSSSVPPTSTSGLTRLLDRAGERAWPALLLASLLLGAAHAIQPGHGKTLVAAATLAPGGGPFRGMLLGLATATAHLASVAVIALAVWATRASRLGDVHLTLARGAGFVIAAVGAWRMGRHLAGFSDHPDETVGEAGGTQSLVALGLAGGALPCWDAVALVVVGATIDRLGLALILVASFSAGMAAVLVAVGAAAGQFRDALARSQGRGDWSRRLGILGGAILVVIGLAMMGT